MKAANVVYAGTFDPVTFGHTDVIERAVQLFGKVTVAITTNPRKKPFFSLQERVRLVKECTKGMKGVKVDCFNCLLVDYMHGEKASVILRGLREMSDFEFEFQQALINRKLAPGIETIFVVTNPKFFYLNSTAVKEIASMGGRLDCFVPACVEKALRRRFGRKKAGH